MTLMTRAALIEAHFLPSLEYWCAISSSSDLILERHEHFEKQSFRNRCFIMTTQGPARLTVPLTGKHGKTTILDVRIDDTSKWQANLWRTLTSAYAKSAYFEHYGDELHDIIFSREKFLFDMNLRLMSLCLKWLGWPLRLTTSEKYEVHTEGEVNDLRNVISAKSSYSERTFYRPVPYQQVFGNKFAPNLSVVDLVFCEGPGAGTILKKSAAV